MEMAKSKVMEKRYEIKYDTITMIFVGYTKRKKKVGRA